MKWEFCKIILLLNLLLLGCIGSVTKDTNSVEVKMTKQHCEDGGGKWRTCGSACTPGFSCKKACVDSCQCGAGFSCPDGFFCKIIEPQESVINFGVCSKINSN